ncbi:MAG: trehalase family glycosidase [Alistipes indistinctus]
MNLAKLSLAAIFCLSTFTARPQTQEAPKPVHPEKWSDIENYIRDNWNDFVDTMPSLPKPYCYALNPGTLYYWDLYFINEGLMRQGFFEQARNNVDNFIYEVEKLGFIPNANGWGEDRSMTPYFGMMVSSYYDKAPEKDTAWLRRAYNAMLKEYEFWTNTNGNTIEDHSTPVEGLQRYGHHSDSATLVSFYDKVLQGRFHLEKMCLRAKRSASRAIDSPKPKRWISTRVSKGGAWISFR